MRRTLRAISVTAFGVAAAAAAGTLGARPGKAAGDPRLDLPFAEAHPCVYLCRVCTLSAGDTGHDIVIGQTGNAVSMHLETCNPGTCSAHACSSEVMPVSRLETLWFEVRAADGGALDALLAAHREVAFYNADRDAVQVRGCEGAILASIPLSPAQVAHLD